MRSNRVIRRILPPVLAFVVAASGAIMLFSSSSPAVVAAPELLPTVVAVTDLKLGTPVSSLEGRTEIRRLPVGARASGAVASLTDLPSDSVLVTAMVAGQQILTSSLGADPHSSIGAGLVAVSVRLDPQRWTGPVAVGGIRVDVYATGSTDGTNSTGATLIAHRAVVLDAPDPATVSPQQETIVTLGVAPSEVAAVIAAISGDGIWLVTT